MPLYARLADQEHRLLEHVCNSLQWTYNDFFDWLAGQSQGFWNLNNTPERFLDWYGQFVALGAIEDHYLGIGLNKDWEPSYKRQVIKRHWRYLQIKGTEEGIRESIDLWLRFPGHDKNKTIIYLPFGKHPTSNPPAWYGYGTEYDAWMTQSFQEPRPFWGSGVYPQSYEPQWVVVQSEEFYPQWNEAWNDRQLVASKPDAIASRGSGIGLQEPWEHLVVNPEQWNSVFPDIHALNKETWSSQSNLAVFGWIDRTTQPLLVKRSITKPSTQRILNVIPDGMQWGELWRWKVVEWEVADQVVNANSFMAVGSRAIAIESAEQTVNASKFNGTEVEGFLISSTGQAVYANQFDVTGFKTITIPDQEQSVNANEFDGTAIANFTINSVEQSINANDIDGSILNELAIATDDQVVSANEFDGSGLIENAIAVTEQSVNANVFDGEESVQLPTHLYYFDIEDAPSAGTTWSSRSGTQSTILTHQNGNFKGSSLGNTNGYASFNRIDYASFSATPGFRAFAAVVWFEIPLYYAGNPNLYCIFADTTNYENSPNNNGGGIWSFASQLASAAWKNTDVYNDGSTTSLGKTTAVTYNSTTAWQGWGIIICNGSTLPLFQYGNIGRDRNFHEFRGRIKALVTFENTLSTQQMSDTFLFLNNKFNIYS